MNEKIGPIFTDKLTLAPIQLDHSLGPADDVISVQRVSVRRPQDDERSLWRMLSKFPMRICLNPATLTL